jgi:hypothetical protein
MQLHHVRRGGEVSIATLTDAVEAFNDEQGLGRARQLDPRAGRDRLILASTA